tara:strand:+ start:3777 stop:4463 length:687 start_codon:yes stop_codon:yes gene_type:complete
MHKLLVSLLFIITLFTSCKKEKQLILNEDSYTLSILIDNNEGNKVYIQKLLSPTEIDSTIVKNGISTFVGQISYPERYILTIETVFGGKMFILENDSINIHIKNNNLMNATIQNSKINYELISVQKESERIYNKIDLLFPVLQRARLENDAISLKDISNKMSLIEQENINFHFSYASKNPNSFISAMILNDLSKRDTIVRNKISKIYSLFSMEVKKSEDSKVMNTLIK